MKSVTCKEICKIVVHNKKWMIGAVPVEMIGVVVMIGAITHSHEEEKANAVEEVMETERAVAKVRVKNEQER